MLVELKQNYQNSRKDFKKYLTLKTENHFKIILIVF